MFFPLNWSRALSMEPRDRSYIPDSDQLVMTQGDLFCLEFVSFAIRWSITSNLMHCGGFSECLWSPRGPGTSFLWPLKGVVCASMLCTVSLGDKTDRQERTCKTIHRSAHSEMFSVQQELEKGDQTGKNGKKRRRRDLQEKNKPAIHVCQAQTDCIRSFLLRISLCD